MTLLLMTSVSLVSYSEVLGTKFKTSDRQLLAQSSLDSQKDAADCGLALSARSAGRVEALLSPRQRSPLPGRTDLCLKDLH